MDLLKSTILWIIKDVKAANTTHLLFFLNQMTKESVTFRKLSNYFHGIRVGFDWFDLFLSFQEKSFCLTKILKMSPEFSQTRQQPPLTFQLLNWMNTCRSYLTSQPLLTWWLFPLPWNYFLHHLPRFFYLGFILLWYSFLAFLKLYCPPLPCKYSFYPNFLHLYTSDSY